MKIKKHTLFVISGLLLSAVLLGCSTGNVAVEAPVVAKKPNLVLILADDCSWFDTGTYGGQAATPVMDRIASEGMKFTSCLQAAPMCSPTRHNLFTGKDPFKTEAYPNHAFAKEGTKSLSHYLGDLGYRVALSGKRHIAPKEVFDFEYLGKGNNPDFSLVDPWVAARVAEGSPFCLLLTSNEPHDPWTKGDASRYNPDSLTLPVKFIDTPEARDAFSRYLAEITYFDSQVGEALALLEKHGVLENTLFVVATEQGSIFPFAKWTCYDAGLKSGFLARWPGHIEAGSVCDLLMEYADLTPTFVEAAGGTPSPELDGKSLLPIFANTQKEPLKEYVYGQMTSVGIKDAAVYYGSRSIRSKEYKYIWNFTPEERYSNVAMSKPFFVSWFEKAKTDPEAAAFIESFVVRPGQELYDIQADPDELNNLAADPKYAELKETLHAALVAHMEEVGDGGQEAEINARDHQTWSPPSKH